MGATVSTPYNYVASLLTTSSTTATLTSMDDSHKKLMIDELKECLKQKGANDDSWLVLSLHTDEEDVLCGSVIREVYDDLEGDAQEDSALYSSVLHDESVASASSALDESLASSVSSTSVSDSMVSAGGAPQELTSRISMSMEESSDSIKFRPVFDESDERLLNESTDLETSVMVRKLRSEVLYLTEQLNRLQHVEQQISLLQSVVSGQDGSVLRIAPQRQAVAPSTPVAEDATVKESPVCAVAPPPPPPPLPTEADLLQASRKKNARRKEPPKPLTAEELRAAVLAQMRLSDLHPSNHKAAADAYFGTFASSEQGVQLLRRIVGSYDFLIAAIPKKPLSTVQRVSLWEKKLFMPLKKEGHEDVEALRRKKRIEIQKLEGKEEILAEIERIKAHLEKARKEKEASKKQGETRNNLMNELSQRLAQQAQGMEEQEVKAELDDFEAGTLEEGVNLEDVLWGSLLSEEQIEED